MKTQKNGSNFYKIMELWSYKLSYQMKKYNQQNHNFGIGQRDYKLGLKETINKPGLTQIGQVMKLEFVVNLA